MSLTPTRNRVGLLKMESTYATDAVPTSANAMLFMNSNIAPMADKLERPLDRPYYGNNPFVLVGKRVEFTAEIDLLGALTIATAAPLGPVFRTCALAETLVAAPLAAPTNSAFSTTTTGGSLAAGTYFYRVTAYNACGETLGSAETSQVTTGTTSTVTVNWGAVAGAAGYRVYGRATGAELFMTDVGNVLTFIDTGAITPAGALPAANTTTGTTYTPVSSGFESSDLYFYEGGIVFKMTGVRGYFDWEYAIKTYAKAKIKLTGILSAVPSDAALPTGINWNVFANPMAIQTESWLVQMNNININATSLAINCGGNVIIHEGSETREVYYADRKSTGTLRVMKDLTLATWNPWALADALTVCTLNSYIVGTSGLQVSNPMRVQLEYPKLVDDQGIVAYEIPFNLIPSSAGNDEFGFGFR